MSGDAGRPPVPYGSTDDWFWMDRNEWGFEGWVLDDAAGCEVWSNYFARAYDFGTGIVVRVWAGEPYESESTDWVVPPMDLDELTEWIASNTPAFAQQEDQDRFFEEILAGFRPAAHAPTDERVFGLADYEGDMLHVHLRSDGTFLVWCEDRKLLAEYPDLCAVKQAYDERLERNWSSLIVNDDWEQRWEACG